MHATASAFFEAADHHATESSEVQILAEQQLLGAAEARTWLVQAEAGHPSCDAMGVDIYGFGWVSC